MKYRYWALRRVRHQSSWLKIILLLRFRAQLANMIRVDGTRILGSVSVKREGLKETTKLRHRNSAVRKNHVPVGQNTT